MIVKTLNRGDIVVKNSLEEELELEVQWGTRDGFEVIHVYYPPGSEVDVSGGHIVVRRKCENLEG